MTEREVLIDGRSVMVRDAGDPDGSPIIYFHGTPGSRLDVGFGDDVASEAGVRVVSFDRPGYGRSEPAAFGLRMVAEVAGGVADELGLRRFATLGLSGGGPFALAASAVLGDRVTRVGVVSGAAPFQDLPGALETLDENDALAESYLPDDPQRAAEQFAVGFEGLVAVSDDEKSLMDGFDAMLGHTDADVLSHPTMRKHIFTSMSEALRQGAMGGGWDNVAWIGSWDIALEDVACPVYLWYGELDPLASPRGGQWIADHLNHAEFVVREGEGHLGMMRHWAETLHALTGPAPAAH